MESVQQKTLLLVLVFLPFWGWAKTSSFLPEAHKAVSLHNLLKWKGVLENMILDQTTSLRPGVPSSAWGRLCHRHEAELQANLESLRASVSHSQEDQLEEMVRAGLTPQGRLRLLMSVNVGEMVVRMSGCPSAGDSITREIAQWVEQPAFVRLRSVQICQRLTDIWKTNLEAPCAPKVK